MSLVRFLCRKVHITTLQKGRFVHILNFLLTLAPIGRTPTRKARTWTNQERIWNRTQVSSSTMCNLRANHYTIRPFEWTSSFLRDRVALVLVLEVDFSTACMANSTSGSYFRSFWHVSTLHVSGPTTDRVIDTANTSFVYWITTSTKSMEIKVPSDSSHE